MKKYLVLFWLIFGINFSVLANELNVYIWSEYLPENIIEKFTKETGIKVNISTYDSNENLYAKVKLLHNSKSGYDLIVPSTYFVSKMRDEGLLTELDMSKINNFKDIDESLTNKPFDPQNKYSIPYLWGSTALCYNTKYVKEKVDSFNILFDPKYAHKILLTDDVRDVFHVALKLLGYSGNDTNEEHIKQAYEKLKILVPNVKIFNSSSPKLNYINEEVIIGLNHNGEAYMASLENPDIKYVYPKEGVILWVDSLTIPSNARNIENAYKFINFLMRPEIAKEISETIGFATANKTAMVLLPKEILNNPTIYPGKEILDKGEFQNDVGEAIVIYEKYWEMLKLGH
jgi:spermidine/putrescine transport system substrate-binding protein